MPTLSNDFPGLSALQAAGVTTTEQLQGRTKESLLTIPGVGDATADRIIAATEGPTTPETSPQAAADAPDPTPAAPALGDLTQAIADGVKEAIKGSVVSDAAPVRDKALYDQTVPMGRYLVNGTAVNADGVPIPDAPAE